MVCDEPIMVGIKEFAKISGLGEKKVRQLARIAGFPAMRCGGVKVMIHREKAAMWLAEYAGHENRHFFI